PPLAAGKGQEGGRKGSRAMIASQLPPHVVRELAIPHAPTQDQQPAVGLGAEGERPARAGPVPEVVRLVVVGRAQSILGAADGRRRGLHSTLFHVRRFHRSLPLRRLLAARCPSILKNRARRLRRLRGAAAGPGKSLPRAGSYTFLRTTRATARETAITGRRGLLAGAPPGMGLAPRAVSRHT